MLERKWSDKQRAEVRRLRANGHTFEEITEATGIPGATVAHILQAKNAKESALQPGAAVSVFLLDGEAVPFARFRRQDATSITLDVEGQGEVIIFKNALKKIVINTLPVNTTVEFKEGRKRA